MVKSEINVTKSVECLYHNVYHMVYDRYFSVNNIAASLDETFNLTERYGYTFLSIVSVCLNTNCDSQIFFR